ncbi:MAG: flavin oxidoreductase, partial [Muribaculaceae bacterium]|nr:flavin oxidoreductase [Muribaculaceae bacterium]
ATTDNLNRCGDFTVAFATEDTAIAADYVGLVSARRHAAKLSATGWHAVKADSVEAPRFDCFPMTMECRIKEKINESETGFYMVAEIVNIVCDEKYLAEDGRPDVEKMELITFDPIHNGYIRLGSKVGNAFRDGLSLK